MWVSSLANGQRPQQRSHREGYTWKPYTHKHRQTYIPAGRRQAGSLGRARSNLVLQAVERARVGCLRAARRRRQRPRRSASACGCGRPQPRQQPRGLRRDRVMATRQRPKHARQRSCVHARALAACNALWIGGSMPCAVTLSWFMSRLSSRRMHQCSCTMYYKTCTCLHKVVEAHRAPAHGCSDPNGTADRLKQKTHSMRKEPHRAWRQWRMQPPPQSPGAAGTAAALPFAPPRAPASANIGKGFVPWSPAYLQ